MLHEAQNMIPLGNLIIGHEEKDKTDWRDPINWLMATVSDENGIQLTAIMTPPHDITLYATGNIIKPKAIKCLIDRLKDREIPGVMTEKSLAECFAEEYATQKGLTFKPTMSQRIYELTEINPNIKQSGDLRLLDERDMHFFPYWVEAFNASNSYGKTEMYIPQDKELYSYRLSTKKLYVLEDN